MKKRAVFNWSGGKDSALALRKIKQQNEFAIVSLLTTVNRETKKSSMHNIPLSLIEQQAQSLGFDLYIVDLTPKGNMEDYVDAMRLAVEHFKHHGVTHFIYGDIFLHDVRSYREKQLKPYGLEVVEPLWELSVEQVMNEFLNSTLKTVIVTISTEMLSKEYIGREINADLINELPNEVDICGENGEYHTFCYDGDIFNYPIPFILREPQKITYPITMEDGTIKEYTYTFAGLEPK